MGNTDKLGRWNGQNGVYLKWSEGDVWKGSVEVPAGGYVEYKLLVKGKHGDMRWEKHHNRVVQLYDGGADLTISGRFDGSLNITKKDAKKNVTVAFNIHKRIPFGHEIAVVGGAKEFGAWNVDDAMPLRWSEGDVWKGETELTSGGQVEYKMITRRIRTGQWKSEFRRDFKRVVQVYSGGNTIQITGEYRGLVDVRLKGSKPKEEKKEEKKEVKAEKKEEKKEVKAEKKEEKKEEKKKDEVKAEKKEEKKEEEEGGQGGEEGRRRRKAEKKKESKWGDLKAGADKDAKKDEVKAVKKEEKKEERRRRRRREEEGEEGRLCALRRRRQGGRGC